MVLSSLATSFDGLSLCSGYVTHTLRTLPPRYYPSCPGIRARLAWVSHAASVRSEPGSNPSLLLSCSSVAKRTRFYPDTPDERAKFDRKVETGLYGQTATGPARSSQSTQVNPCCHKGQTQNPAVTTVSGNLGKFTEGITRILSRSRPSQEGLDRFVLDPAKSTGRERRSTRLHILVTAHCSLVKELVTAA